MCVCVGVSVCVCVCDCVYVCVRVCVHYMCFYPPNVIKRRVVYQGCLTMIEHECAPLSGLLRYSIGYFQLRQIQRKYGGVVDMITSGVVSRLLPTDSKYNADTTRINLDR